MSFPKASIVQESRAWRVFLGTQITLDCTSLAAALMQVAPLATGTPVEVFYEGDFGRPHVLRVEHPQAGQFDIQVLALNSFDACDWVMRKLDTLDGEWQVLSCKPCVTAEPSAEPCAKPCAKPQVTDTAKPKVPGASPAQQLNLDLAP